MEKIDAIEISFVSYQDNSVDGFEEQSCSVITH